MSAKVKTSRADIAKIWKKKGEAHQADHSSRVANPKAQPEATPPAAGGRPKQYGDEATMRLNIMVPVDVYDFIVATMTENKKKRGGLPTTPGSIITAFVRKEMKKLKK